MDFRGTKKTSVAQCPKLGNKIIQITYGSSILFMDPSRIQFFYRVQSNPSDPNPHQPGNPTATSIFVLSFTTVDAASPVPLSQIPSQFEAWKAKNEDKKIWVLDLATSFSLANPLLLR